MNAMNAILGGRVERENWSPCRDVQSVRAIFEKFPLISRTLISLNFSDVSDLRGRLRSETSPGG